MKKIFITGATGYIGTRVCRVLKERDYEIYAAVRKTTDLSTVKSFVTKFIECDLLDPACKDIISGAIRNHGINDIISMTGSVDYHQEYADSKRINVDTVKNLVDAAVELRKSGIPGRIVFLSSVAARGFLEKGPSVSEYINEETDLYQKGKSIYCDVKREAEDVILRAVNESGLDAVIVQPGSLVGRAEGNTSTTNTGLVRKIIKGFPVLSGGASYTSVRRAAEGIVSALENGEAGETYLLGGENITMREFAVRVKRLSRANFPGRFSLNLPVITIPARLARAIGKRNIFINYQQAVLGSAYHYIDYDKAANKLGYKHSSEDFEEAVLEMVAGG